MTTKKLRWGSTTPTKFYYQNTEVKKLYFGNTLVWDTTATQTTVTGQWTFVNSSAILIGLIINLNSGGGSSGVANWPDPPFGVAGGGFPKKQVSYPAFTNASVTLTLNRSNYTGTWRAMSMSVDGGVNFSTKVISLSSTEGSKTQTFSLGTIPAGNMYANSNSLRVHNASISFTGTYTS